MAVQRFVKRSTARDFRLSSAVVKQVLQTNGADGDARKTSRKRKVRAYDDAAAPHDDADGGLGEGAGDAGAGAGANAVVHDPDEDADHDGGSVADSYPAERDVQTVAVEEDVDQDMGDAGSEEEY